MESDLDVLGEKIRQAADTLMRLRSENADMRQRIAALERDNRRLADKVEAAAARLETLLAQLPG